MLPSVNFWFMILNNSSFFSIVYVTVETKRSKTHLSYNQPFLHFYKQDYYIFGHSLYVAALVSIQ